MRAAPQLEGRRERKKRETRERILQVALREFTRQGYDAVTVEALAEAADISKPTLFNYFPSKMAILQALVPGVDQRFAAAIERFRAEGGTAEEQLTRFFAYGAEMTRKTPMLTRALLILALRAYDDPLYSADRHRWPSLHDSFCAMLRDGVARGEVRTDISVERMTHYITGIYVYGLLSWLADPKFSVDVELAVAAAFLGSGVSVTAQAGR
ncbi:TetR/AcrR family transcriptional regulator [Haliea sp. E1-2-M8]|uniref:TetR/AcrR family transcriptional regulator n=1 Tax=Haliea sp. E1-2-M8 TaxID=3064706 RepID=UPI002716F686|nr:TetR/AcrR family transcriptional regulator [Haliea sp. E1-2-M8]MDO8862157.1 TetR/AcrR family transcriptional regulator [Haliea sp. E1-2-M8]